MKQNLSPEQLNELSEKGKEKLLMWCIKYDRDYRMDDLNIGQMIEFLDEHDKFGLGFTICDSLGIETFGHGEDGIDYTVSTAENLCDALWSAVKEVLEQEEKR